MKEYPSRQVNIYDSFWTPRLELNANRAIFHQWEQLEASGCIDNFRIAAGELDGFREGWFFADSDAYKWLDAASRIQACWPDTALDQLLDNLIALLGRTQETDGYLFTFNQVHFPGTRWHNLMIEHELYCHGHLIEAGVSHSESTGKTSLLEIARMAADRVIEDFLGKGPDYTPGHEEIEIALLRLYHLTGHPPYLAIARQFIEQRGRKARIPFVLSQIRQLRSAALRRATVSQQRNNYFTSHPGYSSNILPPNNYAKTPPYSYLRWLLSDLDGKYLQQHVPIRRQTIPVGHSVRFGYLETAAAMLQRIDSDESLFSAMEVAWDRMVARRMYVTGGIGSVPGLEGFGNDYELDPEYAYAETCAALASLFWSWEMVLISGDAKYSDLFEWQLYNAVSVGMGLSGTNYLYNNPLACRGGITRRPWFAIPCCPSNLSRTWASLGKYLYSSDADALWIHQYIGSSTNISINVPVRVAIESGMPWNGSVRICVTPAESARFTVYIRIPSWVSDSDVSTAIKVNNEPAAAEANQSPRISGASEPTAQGYDPRRSRFLSITRRWSPGDELSLDFDMPIILHRTHSKVKGHRDKVVISRGPLVYCLESNDNPGIDIFSTRLEPTSLELDASIDLGRETVNLRGRSFDGRPLTFIPYFLWANRGESQMTVWVNT